MMAKFTPKIDLNKSFQEYRYAPIIYIQKGQGKIFDQFFFKHQFKILFSIISICYRITSYVDASPVM